MHSLAGFSQALLAEAHNSGNLFLNAGASAAGYARKLWFALGALLGAATLALIVLAILLRRHVKMVIQLLKVSIDYRPKPHVLLQLTSVSGGSTREVQSCS